jgi:hypothetical protein
MIVIDKPQHRRQENSSMVLTRGGQPDKHITPSQTQGPQATGQNYNAGNPNAPMSLVSDAAAAGTYGNPDAPDATRMNRMANLAREAAQSDGTTESYGDPFVAGNDWTLTANKTINDSGDMPTSPGFPGNDPSDAEFSYLGQPPGNQGKDISEPVATKAAPSVNNSGSPQFSGKGY